MAIKLINQDITSLKVDAIVNAAQNDLMGGGGIDGVIHRKAGKELDTECKTLHGCKTGYAKITKGYKLPAKYIIHTVGPDCRQVKDKNLQEYLLTRSYLNSLRLAKANNIHSIAFPAISTGTYQFDKPQSVKIATTIVHNWLKNNPDYDLDVYFDIIDPELVKLYEKALHK